LTSREREAFERSLLEAMDETLSLVLSERTKEAVYAHMERFCNLKRDEIPIKPDLLTTCLEKIFGRAATVIEKMVLRRFCSKLGIDFDEKKDWSFKDHVVFVERSVGAFSRCQ